MLSTTLMMMSTRLNVALLLKRPSLWVTAATALLASVLATTAAHAQIAPDRTLGSESSVVTEGVDVRGELADFIEGGAVRGSNLFHSFLEFNVDDAQRVYFADPAGIESIFSRTTGDNPSDIFGTLGVAGRANLFLINPNGIVFGQSSSLDVEGSLVVTTADAIQFGDQGFFSATEPEALTTLTVDPSALWFNQIAPSSITNNSITQIDSIPSGQFLFGLKAPTDRSLLFVGGDINMLRGRIVGSGSNIELGGLAEPGVVSLETDENSIRLAFSEESLRSNITLDEGGQVSLVGRGGGNISAYANRLTATNGGELYAVTEGIENGGSINVEANQIELSGVGSDAINSGFLSEVSPNATGNAGAISVTAESIVIRDGAKISSLSFGAGVAGDVEVVADVINVSGTSTDRQSASTIRSISGENSESTPATDAAGDVTIRSRQLSVRDGGQITTRTLGGGVGGNLSVTVRETTELAGAKSLSTGSTSSGLFTGTTGVADAGSLRLETGQLFIREGALIDASTFGAGAAGDIEVVTDTIDVSGISADQLFPSTIRSISGRTFEGVPATGAAGDVTIRSRQLSVQDGGQIVTRTEGGGAGGNLSVAVQGTTDLVGSEVLATGSTSSGLFTGTTGVADAGSLRLETGQLFIREGAGIDTSTFGTGAASDVEVVADTIDVSGVSADRRQVSAIRSISGRTSEGVPATGAAGDVTIRSRQLSVRDGGQITTGTAGGGAGGSLSVAVQGTTDLVGSEVLATGGTSSGLFTDTTGVADAGSLRLETGQLFIREGALVDASTFGAGAAGDIEVAADTIDVAGIRADQLFPSAIRSISGETSEKTLATGAAGDVTIRSRQLSIRDGGRITAGTEGGGRGGNLSVAVQEITEIVGSGNLGTGNDGSSSSGLTTRTLGIADAGGLRLETGQLSIREGAAIAASTFSTGAAGDVEVVADAIDVSGVSADRQRVSAIRSISGRTSEGVPAVGAAGNVTIRSRQLSVRDGGQIATGTAGGGTGGSLFIMVSELIELVGSGETFVDTGEPTSAVTSSGLTTETLGVADAGSLRLETGQLSIREGAWINASTFGAGAAGDVEVVANSINVIGVREDQLTSSAIQSISGQTLEGASATGAAGNVAISTRRLDIEDGVITTLTAGEALAGKIEINVRDRLEARDSEISTTSLQAAGGDIRINTSEGFDSGVVVLRGDSDITTSSRRDGGSIEIRGSAIVAFDDSDILTTSEDGSGGDITLGNFFSDHDPFNTAPPLDGNGRVDVNAEGRIASGNISTPDVSFIENSLDELSSEIVDTETITARSCIARDSRGIGSFLITGSELPQQPEGNLITVYSTGTIQPILQTTATSILREPQDVYQTADGRLVLSYECES